MKFNEQDKEWYSSDLRKLRAKRDETYVLAILTDANEDWTNHKEVSKLYSDNVKLAKSGFYLSKLQCANGDQKKYLENIKIHNEWNKQ